MSSSWQSPLAKLIGLIVILPFASTYLHLYYYAYWKNEYCFVGPTTTTTTTTTTAIPSHDEKYNAMMSSATATVVDSSIGSAANGDNNKLRGIETTATTEAAAAGSTQFHGIYAPISSKKKKKNNDRRQFQQKHHAASNDMSTMTSWFWGGGRSGWPSITQSSIMISSPSSQLSNHQHLHNVLHEKLDHVISLNEEEMKWCLQSSSSSSTAEEEYKWCSDPISNHFDSTDTIHTYPTSGIYKPTSTIIASNTPSLVISCPTSSSSSFSSSTAKSKHKRQNAKQNANLQFILNHPATTFLLLLNTGLAFYYWNHRINPGLVCKQYTKIVVEDEWWRGLTGATAHFEPLHIGFNMMSLHTLGKELEGGFGSIVFLTYNAALIAFTTVVMMGMVHARVRWIQHKLDRTTTMTSGNNLQLQQTYREQQARLRETSSVGYSAVLFAWMVVSTMERKAPTCPIPFFSDVCFSTYSVPGIPFLKFNVSPIVSLFVAQFIMPRVSFMGHLAGIICGFCLHWGWAIPPLEICSTNVLFGGAFLLGLIWKRRVVPVRPLLTAMMDEEGCVEHEDYLRSLLADGGVRDDGDPDDTTPTIGQNSTTDPFARGKQKKKERELQEYLRKQKTLLYVRYLIGIVALASLFAFDWSSSIVLCQCLLLAYFTFGTQSSLIVWAYTRSKEPSDIIEPERARSGMIWRGFFLSAVLAIVVDSMSMASWFVFPTLIASERPSLPLGLFPVSVVMVLRTAVNLLAMILSSKILHDMSQVGCGIFAQLFSAVIKWSKLVGDHGMFMLQKPLWTAFEGRGITLGRAR